MKDFQKFQTKIEVTTTLYVDIVPIYSRKMMYPIIPQNTISLFIDYIPFSSSSPPK